MRDEARDTCYVIRPEIEKLTSGYAQLNGETRGLENRACRQRQNRKSLGLRCVLKAQRKLDSHKLACLAYKCSHNAAVLALEEAARDFTRAYMEELCLSKRPLVEEDTTPDLPAIDVEPSTSSLEATVAAVNLGRRVRPRTAV